MRTPCLKHAIELALAGVGPIADIVARSQEVGTIVPSILTKNLEKAGYVISYRSGPGVDAPPGSTRVGAWVLVFDKEDTVVARAYSHVNGAANFLIKQN